MASGFPIDAGATVPKMRKVERSDFGARLRAARLDADVSQEDLAKAAGLAQSSVTELERSGQGSAAVTRMARKLNVDAHWLATGEGDRRNRGQWPFDLFDQADFMLIPREYRERVENELAGEIQRLKKRPNGKAA